MTTVLHVLALWLVLSGLAAAAVCLVLTGARLHEQRDEDVALPALPLPRRVEQERSVSA